LSSDRDLTGWTASYLPPHEKQPALPPPGCRHRTIRSMGFQQATTSVPLLLLLVLRPPPSLRDQKRKPAQLAHRAIFSRRAPPEPSNVILRSSKKPTLNHACRRDRMDPSRAESRGSGLFPPAAPSRMISRRSFSREKRVGSAATKRHGAEKTTREGSHWQVRVNGACLLLCLSCSRKRSPERGAEKPRAAYPKAGIKRERGLPPNIEPNSQPSPLPG